MKFLDKLQSILNWLNKNQRNIENGKTVLLWILVLSSLLLTWSLWTYNPAYDLLKKQGTFENVKIEPTGSKKLNQIVRPIQVIYNQGGKSYFSITDDVVRNDLYDKLLDSMVVNVNNVKINKINGLDDPNSFIEFIFPSDISQKVFEQLFSLENKIPLVPNIDRIYLFQKNVDSEKKNYLRLISYQQSSFVDLEIQLDYQFFQDKVGQADIRKPYFDYYVHDEKGNVEKLIYLPTDKVDVSLPIKFVRKIKPEDFKVALFDDPSFVNREESNNKLFYSDDKQYLSIREDTNEMSYRSIVTDMGEDTLTDFERLNKSIKFINRHFGWTDDYVIFDEEDAASKTFRLIVDGIPVFNELGVIQLRWNEGQVYEYNRSLINLSYEYPRNFITENMSPKVDPNKWPSLMSGYDVINLLKQTNKLGIVKDIKIGYNMHKYNNSNSFYEFKPNWYYFNGENWIPIYNEVGGDSADGLEKN